MKIPSVLMLCLAVGAPAQSVTTYMGRKVTLTLPKLDEGGLSPEGPATVCLEAPPRRQCYSPPKDFTRDSEVRDVELKKGISALFFSAESYGVSGWAIYFALLVPGDANHLDDRFFSDTRVSNQSQHAFWREPSISDALIFLTADYAWGPDEAHVGEHRYIVSAYVDKQTLGDGPHYYLEDRYMTVRKYDLLNNQDVLSSERQEILARLRRLSPRAKLPR